MFDDFDEFDGWRLADGFTLNTAAALICGGAPSRVCSSSYDDDEVWYYRTETGECDTIQHAFSAVLDSLAVASKKGTLKADSVYFGKFNHVRWDGDESVGNWEPAKAGIDTARTTVSRDDLVSWLSSRGLSTGFFFPSISRQSPDYLNPKNPRYAPKLAAAVRAWQAVTDPSGKHPKQALAKWLREHAAEFGMTDDEGKPNETGIEEAAKVANWQPGGGAPKTPGE